MQLTNLADLLYAYTGIAVSEVTFTTSDSAVYELEQTLYGANNYS